MVYSEKKHCLIISRFMKTRIIWVDSLKGFLILLVILGHAIQKAYGDSCFDNKVFNLIYSFHMAAFMAVSGWLMYKPCAALGGGN